jgi:CBS domain-containing protein
MPVLWEILDRRPPVLHSLPPDATVAEAARVMAENEVGAVVVTSRHRLMGIFSERDLLRRVVVPELPMETKLREVMTANPVTVSPDDDRAGALEKMQSLGCRHLPVVSEGRPVDVISIRDLVFDEIHDRDYEIAELNRYIRGAW